MSVEEVLQRIKAEPITHIVGQFLPLTKKGSNTFALCPFHDDSHPSMSVHDGLGIYHCFTCGAKGDVINFVQNYKHLDFMQALRALCDVVGISTELLDSGQPKNPKFELAYKVLQAASKIYFHTGQKGNFPAFKSFLKDRHLDDELVHKFQIGFAAQKNTLTAYLQSLPQDKRLPALNIAEEIGLIAKSADGQIYDKFRQRIMFPIWDERSRIVAFTSRAIHQDQKPKYLNSKASFIFDKQNLLYGLNFAKQEIRALDFVLLVEGQMDVITLHRFGFPNVVAASGTAFTEKMLTRLLRQTSHLVFAMDSDEAGFKAMQRMHPLCLEHEKFPKFLNFEPYKDADEFLNAEGGLKLQEKIEQAPLFLDILIEHELAGPVPETIGQKVALLDQVFKVLAPLKDHLIATEKCIKIAKQLQLQSDPTMILQRYQSIWGQNADKKSPAFDSPQLEEQEKQLEETQNQKSMKAATPNAPAPSVFELQLLSQTVEHPSIMHRGVFAQLLDFVEHNEVKMFVWNLRRVYSEIDENEFVPIIEQHLKETAYSAPIDNEVRKGLGRYRNRPDPDKPLDKLALDLKRSLNLQQLKQKKKDIMLRQKQSDNQQELQELMSELITIQKQIDGIISNKVSLD